MSFFNTLPNNKIWIFKIFPVAIITALICAAYFFYSALLSTYLQKNEILLITLVYTALHIINMRSLFEGLYWMSSTICYQLAAILFFTMLGAAIRYMYKPSFLYGFMLLFCCLALPGTAEIISPVLIITLTGFLFIYAKNKNKKIILIAILVVFCAAIIVFLSPGNNNRVQNDQHNYHPGLITAVFYSLRAVCYYFLLWLVNPSNIFAVVLIELLLLRRIRTSFKFISTQKLLIAFISLIFLCATIYFPLFYFESSLPFPRVTTLVFFVGAHLFFIFLFLLLKKYQSFRFQNKIFSFISQDQVNNHLTMLFFIFIFTSNNFISVSKDVMSGTAYYFNKEAIERFKSIRSCTSDTCHVSYYKDWPSSIEPFKKESDNSNPFIHVNKYFGKTILYKK